MELNLRTGERWTAPSGGYTPPSEDWVTAAGGDQSRPGVAAGACGRGCDEHGANRLGAAPYRTIQAALDHIGAPADADEYAAEAGRAYAVRVAPGVYAEDLEVPYRPAILIDLCGATVRGTVTRRVPAWPRSWTGLVSRLTIRGDSLRAAYPDDQHTVVGIEGDVVFDGGGQTMEMSPSTFHELHVIHAGISGAVRYENGSAVTWGHIFLERADVRGIVCTNGWSGTTLYAHNWGGGHVGGGSAGSGLGPLVGRVLPYNLQDVLISDGMRLETTWAGRACGTT